MGKRRRARRRPPGGCYTPPGDLGPPIGDLTAGPAGGPAEETEAEDALEPAAASAPEGTGSGVGPIRGGADRPAPDLLRDAPPPRPAGIRSQARGRALPAGWEQWELGPYTRWPEPRRRVHEYYLMRSFDPIVKSGLSVIRALILGRLGRCEHPDPDISARITAWLENIEGGVRRVVSQLLSALWAGFAVVELRWRLGEEWTVASTALLHPLSFFSRWGREVGLVPDPHSGRVEIFRQLPQAAGEDAVELPAERVLYWPAFAELREQVFGQSLLEAARPIWFARVRLGAYWNTYCERLAAPTPVIQVPVDTVEDPRTGQTVSAADYVADVFASLEPGMALALPYSPGMEWKVEPLIVGGDGGKAFDLRLAALEREMWLAMLTPRLLMAEPEFGTRAMAETNLGLFLDVIDGIRREVGEVLEEQLINRMLALNISGAERAKWAWDPLQEEDLERMARVLQTVQQSLNLAWQRGPINPADEELWRQVFGAVLASAGDAAAAAEEAGSAGEGPAELAARLIATGRRYLE